MPLRKAHELTFLWFGLPGPLLFKGGRVVGRVYFEAPREQEFYYALLSQKGAFLNVPDDRGSKTQTPSRMGCRLCSPTTFVTCGRCDRFLVEVLETRLAIRPLAR